MATIQMAQRKVRELRRLDGPSIKDGVHIILKGEINGLPAEAQSNVWMAEIPGVGGNKVLFRQMWVNGVKAQRASTLTDGELPRIISVDIENETFEIPIPEAEFNDFNGLEFVIHQWWAIAMLRVKTIGKSGDNAVKKWKPQASQNDIIKIGRIVTVIGAVSAIFLTLAIDSIKGLKLFDVFQAVLGFIAPPMSVVFLFGVLYKKTTTRAANLALIGGTIFSFVTGVFYLWIFPSQEYDFWPHFLLLSFIIFVIISIVTYVVTITDKNASEKNQNTLDFGKLSKTPKKVWIYWSLLIITMIGLYVLFNRH